MMMKNFLSTFRIHAKYPIKKEVIFSRTIYCTLHLSSFNFQLLDFFVFWIGISIIKVLGSVYLQHIILKLLLHRLHTVFKLGKNKFRNIILTD